jgi:hypothetical protein
MTPRIGPYSPLAAILAKAVVDTSAVRLPPRFRPTLLAVSDAGSVVSPPHDSVSARFRRRWYAERYAESLDPPGWSA